MKNICEFYCYGHCNKRSGFMGNAHISMGCPYETRDGDPAPKKMQKCEDYMPKDWWDWAKKRNKKLVED